LQKLKSKGTESDKGKGAKGSASSKKAKKSSSSDGESSGKTRASKSTTKSRSSGGKLAATAVDEGGTAGSFEDASTVRDGKARSSKGSKNSQGKKPQNGSSKKAKGAPYAVDDDAEAEEAGDAPVAAQGVEFDVGQMGGGKDRYTGKRADARAKFKKGVNAVRANNAAAAGKKKKGSAAEAQGAAPRKGNKVPV